MNKQCPKCGEELEESEIGYHCRSLAGCWYYEKKQTSQLPTEPIELSADRYKLLQLLKKQYPHGHAGYKMEFRVAEFFETDFYGRRKYLHVHVVVKKGNAELLKVRVPKIPLIIEYESHHEKKSIRNEWKKLIEKNIDNIMTEIKSKLAEHGISLSDWGIENY